MTPAIVGAMYLVLLAATIALPDVINYNMAVTMLMFFAMLLSVSIVVPIATMILHWNQSLGNQKRQSPPM